MLLVLGNGTLQGSSMKKYFFPIFITALGLFTAYVFYALWHSEELSPPKKVKQTKTNMEQDHSMGNMTSQRSSDLTVPDASMSQQVEEHMVEEELSKEDISSKTPEQLQAQTDEVYESLTPENHEETMEAAAEAFEQLDTYVEELDAQLAQEEQDVQESMENVEEESVADDLSTDDDMQIPENEEEVNMEQEDVNNL